MLYFVFIQRGFPCKPFVTHCTEIRPWLLIMCMLSDIIISFSLILQRSFTCTIRTTWERLNEYIIFLFFNTSWGSQPITWANGVTGRRCVVLQLIAQRLQNDQSWNLTHKCSLVWRWCPNIFIWPWLWPSVKNAQQFISQQTGDELKSMSQLACNTTPDHSVVSVICREASQIHKGDITKHHIRHLTMCCWTNVTRRLHVITLPN